MLDFGYLRYIKTGFYGFDTISLTGSFNSQREERINQGGQGNPFADIVNQYERTSVLGFSFYLDKRLGDRNTFLFGSDYYHEKVNAPAFTTNVVTGVVTLSRPRIPDEARFNSAGLYVQDAWEAIPDRLRITGALRYSSVAYDVRAADAPIVAGRRLWNDDSLRTGGFSGRIGGVLRVVKGFRVAANYSRGFRYPAITDLGTLGLTGDGFEVDYLASCQPRRHDRHDRRRRRGNDRPAGRKTALRNQQQHRFQRPLPEQAVRHRIYRFPARYRGRDHETGAHSARRIGRPPARQRSDHQPKCERGRFRGRVRQPGPCQGKLYGGAALRCGIRSGRKNNQLAFGAR